MVWPRDINRPLREFRDLILEAEEAYGRVPDWGPETFDSNDLAGHGLRAPDDHGFVYFFEIVGGDHSVVIEKMREAQDGGYKVPRIPKPDDLRLGTILYVGSSGRDVQGRLRQHCGVRPVATYSLKLEAWKDGVPGFSARAHIRGYRGLSRGARELLEDAVAAELRPMVGKRGGNGR